MFTLDIWCLIFSGNGWGMKWLADLQIKATFTRLGKSFALVGCLVGGGRQGSWIRSDFLAAYSVLCHQRLVKVHLLRLFGDSALYYECVAAADNRKAARGKVRQSLYLPGLPASEWWRKWPWFLFPLQPLLGVNNSISRKTKCLQAYLVLFHLKDRRL